MHYKNYYQKDDFDRQDDTNYNVNNDINSHVPVNMYESDYTICSVKKQIKRSQQYEDDSFPTSSSADVSIPSNNSEGIVKSIVSLCFAAISVCVLLFIANLYYALKPSFDSAEILKDETTDFAARTLGPQSYVFIGFAGLFFIISLILSISSIKTFAKGGVYGTTRPVITLVFGIISLAVTLFAIILTILLFLGSPILII